jgi:hypothetical protein
MRAMYIIESEELHPKIKNVKLCSSLKSSKESNTQKWLSVT